jgi:ABC-type phosphate transport system substrate-binding protein
MQARYARALAAGAAVAMIAVGGCGSGKPLHGTITGVQATASQQLARAWGVRFERATGAHVRTRAGGVAGFASGAADFAMVDAPPSAAVRAKGEAVAIPVALSPVVIAYNIIAFTGTRVPAGVRFDGAALARVFNGVKFNWAQRLFIGRNNARMGIRLPDELFQVCRDPGTSAANAALTTYFASSLPSWAKSPGAGARVNWPKLEVPVIETADLASCVKRSSGGIGYMPLADARREGLTVASLQAPGGRGPFYAPQQPGYPIEAPELALVWHDMCRAGLSAQDAVNVRAWLDFTLSASAQAMALRYGYQPLLAAARASARAQVATLRCDGKPISATRVSAR